MCPLFGGPTIYTFTVQLHYSQYAQCNQMSLVRRSHNTSIYSTITIVSMYSITAPTCSLICMWRGSSENDLEIRGVSELGSWQEGPRSSGTDFFLIIPKPGRRDFLPWRGVYVLGIFRRTRGLEKRPGAGAPLPSLNIVRNTL